MEVALFDSLVARSPGWLFPEGLHFGDIESLNPMNSDSPLGLCDLLENGKDTQYCSTKLSSCATTHDFDTSSSDSSSTGYDQFGTNECLRYPIFDSLGDSTSSMLCFEQSEHVEEQVSLDEALKHAKAQFNPIEWLKNGGCISDSTTIEVSSGKGLMTIDAVVVQEKQNSMHDEILPLVVGSKNKRPLKTLDETQTSKRHCVGNENKNKDPQSIAARHRREKISERLKILQDLVPNGSKVDLVSMLEKAISYVKFLQLQVKILATDDFWPSHGGRVPDIAQVKEAMDAIVSSREKR